jgi:hypothetical protein
MEKPNIERKVYPYRKRDMPELRSEETLKGDAQGHKPSGAYPYQDAAVQGHIHESEDDRAWQKYVTMLDMLKGLRLPSYV